MEMTIERFRREALKRREGRARGARPYSSTEKEFAVRCAHEGLDAGRTISAVARDLGVSEMTLASWCGATPPKPTTTRAGNALRRVVIRDEPPSAPSSIVIVTASGHRVHGLDVAMAAELLRALA